MNSITNKSSQSFQEKTGSGNAFPTRNHTEKSNVPIPSISLPKRFAGIESCPGLLKTGLISGLILGTAGYYGTDRAVDYILRNLHLFLI
jgi:hypothetical protein